MSRGINAIHNINARPINNPAHNRLLATKALHHSCNHSLATLAAPPLLHNSSLNTLSCRLSWAPKPILWWTLDAPCVNSATVLASPFQSTLQVVSNDPWGYFVKSSTLVGLTHKGTHSTWPTKHNTNWGQTGRLHWTRRDTISQACN